MRIYLCAEVRTRDVVWYSFCMKQKDPHYTRMVLVIGVMLVALAIVSVQHIADIATAQEAAVLRAYGR